ncbi:thyroid hormone receptor beta-like isoform X3 [Watersipora subatra]|uniref:thyroid hormone receptor beta-like isoform X3 n=1 Tax=Watersipora subatra TaxID=2589382 RepID=UPI00355B74BF
MTDDLPVPDEDFFTGLSTQEHTYSDSTSQQHPICPPGAGYVPYETTSKNRNGDQSLTEPFLDLFVDTNGFSLAAMGGDSHTNQPTSSLPSFSGTPNQQFLDHNLGHLNAVYANDFCQPDVVDDSSTNQPTSSTPCLSTKPKEPKGQVLHPNVDNAAAGEGLALPVMGGDSHNNQPTSSQSLASKLNPPVAAADSADTAGASDVQAKEKPKKQVRHHNVDKSTAVCVVCCDKATGYHFGAITCESCKAFFRRHAKTKIEPCDYDNKCVLDINTRRHCPACRLKKCLEGGMDKNFIQDEKARASRKKPVRKKKTASEGARSEVASSSNSRIKEMSAPNSHPQPLTSSQKEEIDAILRAHELIDAPDTRHLSEDIELIKHSKQYCVDGEIFRKLTDQPQHAAELLNMVESFAERFIKFLMSLDHFKKLHMSAKFAMLKNCMMDIMAIRSALQYHPDIGGYSVVDTTSGSSKHLRLEFIRTIFGEEIYKEHLKFISSFRTAALEDKTAMILAMIIIVFTVDRTTISEDQQVTVDQHLSHYSELLLAYLCSVRPCSEAKKIIYPRIVMKITDLRNYAFMSQGAIANQEGSSADAIEPLLRELLLRDPTPCLPLSQNYH